MSEAFGDYWWRKFHEGRGSGAVWLQQSKARGGSPADQGQGREGQREEGGGQGPQVEIRFGIGYETKLGCLGLGKDLVCRPGHLCEKLLAVLNIKTPPVPQHPVSQNPPGERVTEGGGGREGYDSVIY